MRNLIGYSLEDQVSSNLDEHRDKKRFNKL